MRLSSRLYVRIFLGMVLTSSAVLVSAASVAQSAPPPMVGEKPLVQVKPRGAAKEAAMKPQPMAVRLQACLEIDDATKERLNCYDAVIAPAPKPKAPKAKTVGECRFTKEEDERLTCFNGFVESMPKLPKS
jgi:hypothetical protein